MNSLSDSLLAARCAAHNIGPRWLAAVAASWVALWVLAETTIPLKYPYEARGQVVDSGVVIGLLLPLAVMNIALDEGPQDLIGGAARSLAVARGAFAAGFLVVAGLLSSSLAWASALPSALVLADAILLAAMVVLGSSVFGVRLGWLPAAALAFTMSAPGLIPWHLNVVYHKQVGPEFALLVSATAVAAIVVFTRLGAVGVRRIRVSDSS